MTFWNKKKPSETETKQAVTPTQGATSVKQAQAPEVVTPAVEQQKAAPLTERPERAAPASTSEDLLSERYGKLRSALGPGTVIQGKLSFDTPVRMDGKLNGEVFSSKALIIGREGNVDAKVEVASLIIMGKVKGNIRASERVELLAGGSIEGDVVTPIFVMEEGALLNGSCTVLPAEKKPSANKGSATGHEKAPEKKAEGAKVSTSTTGPSAAPAPGTTAGLH